MSKMTHPLAKHVPLVLIAAPDDYELDFMAGWPAFAPGIRRRVLWQRDGQAALLYHAQAGAQVPHHTHGHDEECLMVQGELFLDDVLLQPGDYQLAPAGTGHRITDEWMARFRERRNEGLVRDVKPITGAVQAAAQLHELTGGRIACVANQR